MSYTGIKEIDDVLLDLYDEQTAIEKRLSENPMNKKLSERLHRLTTLINKLHDAGKVIGELDAQHLAGSPEPVQGTPEVA